MKTIYTDRFGIHPWVLLFLAAMSFWWAYETLTGDRHPPFGIEKTLGGTIFVLSGGYWLFRATKRFRDIRSARREGRDPTIIRIKE